MVSEKHGYVRANEKNRPVKNQDAMCSISECIHEGFQVVDDSITVSSIR